MHCEQPCISFALDCLDSDGFCIFCVVTFHFTLISFGFVLINGSLVGTLTSCGFLESLQLE